MTATILRFPTVAPPEPFEAEYLALIATDVAGKAPGVVIDLVERRAVPRQDNRPELLETTTQFA